MRYLVFQLSIPAEWPFLNRNQARRRANRGWRETDRGNSCRRYGLGLGRVNDEEIICTPSHPFYSPAKGWTDAVHLRAGDILVLVNGEYVVVEKVQHELLESPVKVYNFQVADYHTYYVSESGVLVHNVCRTAKEAQLPTEGKIRYVPPKNTGNTLPRTSTGGYIDRFSNIWTKGPSRTLGEPFEWDVQLSKAGKRMLGWLSRDRRHINVSPKGIITHL